MTEPPAGPPAGSPAGPPAGPPPPPYSPAPPPPVAPPESAEERPDRRGLLLGLVTGVGAGLLILGLAVVVPFVQERAEPTLEDVQRYDELSYDHVSGDLDYPQSPPVGGAHADEWWECGVYDEPVRDENAVHSLEHGTVWITYRPGLSDDDLDRLAKLLPENGILSPYPGLPAPVVVTVWGRQLHLDGADDDRLPLFLRAFGAGETAPEPFASCHGGTTDPSGGEGVVV